MTPFSALGDGTPIHLITLTNAAGWTADITTLGATLVRLRVPDRSGALDDVVLGHDRLQGYLDRATNPYLGSVVGRFGNRIAHGRFTLDGASYSLATNNAPGGIPCHLHGGDDGFDMRAWKAERLGPDAVRLTLVSADGDQGYPGTVTLSVTYRLGQRGLELSYSATSDKATVLNPTNHTYFNLRGEGLGDVLGHVLTLDATHYLPTDAGLIPTGELRPVAGTPFDFTRPTTIGSRIDADNQDLRNGAGYDHNFIIDGAVADSAPQAAVAMQLGSGDKAPTVRRAARVEEPLSGRVMEVWTSEPGVQLYTGNFLDGSFPGKRGRAYGRRHGFCLETQHYPDSPNRPQFPTTVLRPGQTFRSVTEFRFTTV